MYLYHCWAIRKLFIFILNSTAVFSFLTLFITHLVSRSSNNPKLFLFSVIQSRSTSFSQRPTTRLFSSGSTAIVRRSLWYPVKYGVQLASSCGPGHKGALLVCNSASKTPTQAFYSEFLNCSRSAIRWYTRVIVLLIRSPSWFYEPHVLASKALQKICMLPPD